MIKDKQELAAQIRMTHAFVDADFEWITLIPRKQVRSSTGGLKWEEQAPREPQKFHITERVSNAMMDNRVAGGTQDEEEMTIVGYEDAVLAAHDIFTLRGSQWELKSVSWFNGYEQRAQVIRYGS